MNAFVKYFSNGRVLHNHNYSQSVNKIRTFTNKLAENAAADTTTHASHRAAQARHATHTATEAHSAHATQSSASHDHHAASSQHHVGNLVLVSHTAGFADPFSSYTTGSFGPAVEATEISTSTALRFVHQFVFVVPKTTEAPSAETMTTSKDSVVFHIFGFVFIPKFSLQNAHSMTTSQDAQSVQTHSV